MIIKHHDFSIELPDEWWEAAGMSTFVCSATAYPADESELNGKRLCIVRIDDIAPVHRTPGVQIFRNRTSVVGILRGFIEGAALPPVELLKTRNAAQSYRLLDGTHRLYCSLAAGFTQIYAIRGFDFALFDWRRDEHDQELC